MSEADRIAGPHLAGSAPDDVPVDRPADDQMRRLVQAMGRESVPSDASLRASRQWESAGRHRSFDDESVADRELLDEAYRRHVCVAKSFRSTLQQILQTPVRVGVHQVKRVTETASRFPSDQPIHSVVLIAKSEDRDRSAQQFGWIHIDLRLAFALIDHLLGGDPRWTDFAGRLMTDLERRLLDRLIDAFSERWRQAWSDADAGLRRETDSSRSISTGPNAMGNVTADGALVGVELDLMLSGIQGSWTCVMPVSSLHAVSTSDESDADCTEEQQETDPLVELVVTLPMPSPSLADALPSDQRLAVGDLIELQMDETLSVQVEVAGAEFCRGRIGQADGRKAVRLLKAVTTKSANTSAR